MADNDALDYRALFEAVPGKYLVLTPDLTIVAVSQAYLQATMTERSAIIGRGLFDVFPDNPNDPGADGVSNLRASLARVIHLHVQDTMAVQKYDIRRPESEGGGFEARYWSPVNTPVLSASGSLRWIVHRVEDVTEFMNLKRDEAAHARRADEALSRAQKMEAEVYQRARDLQNANQQIRELNDDLERRVEARTADLRSAEAQLQQAQKMEAVGRLTGGIAHDFNNMLSVILTYAVIAKDSFAAGDDGYACIEQVERAAERSAALTRKLLAFSRQQVTQPKALDLNAIVIDMRGMLERLVSEQVVVREQLGVSIGLVRADRGQLEQVMANLVVNARDAMPDGGQVMITTSAVRLEADALPGQAVVPGPYVALSIRDQGIGMDAATQARIFEPFFTTKALGKGTGLGMSMVHGIVSHSGGHVRVRSAPGDGTEITIYLPQLPADTKIEEERADPKHVPHGTECVLLVEDETLVREAASKILHDCGYRVLTAPSGTEALALCKREAGAVALLITDVVMPGMKGPELASAAQLLLPNLRVLYMSGYTEHLAPVVAASFFVEKPFTPETLARKVRAALDA